MANNKIQLGTSIVTPIVGLIKSEISLNELKVNKNEVEEAFIASFRHLSDPKVTGYTQFRVKGTPGLFFMFFATSQTTNLLPYLPYRWHSWDFFYLLCHIRQSNSYPVQ